MAGRQAEYAQALDTLDRMHRAGQIGNSAYELKRARLVAEASAVPRSWSVKFLIEVAVAIAAFLVLLVVVWIIAGIQNSL